MKWNKPIFKSDVCEIKRHIRGQHDVFFGDGFVDWARIIVEFNLKNDKKTIKQLAGKPLTKFQRHYLIGVV